VNPARNDPCPCGSGKKYKKCCGQIRTGTRVRADHPPADAVTAADMSQLAAMIDAGSPAELETKSREVLDRHPTSGVVWQILGISLTRQGKDALETLEMASQLLPNDAGAQSNLGNALGKLGRLDEAVASYRRALALSPDFAEAHANLGQALLDLGQIGNAADSCRRAVALKPHYAEAHDTLGNALLRLGRPDDAAASLRRALAINPEFIETHLNLGNALLQLVRVDDAVASYRRALEIKPNLAAAHVNLSIALRLQGRTAEAQASCRRALEIDPRSAAAFAVLAESSADGGQFAEAEDLFKCAISIEPESPEAWAGIVRLRKMTLSDAAWLAEAQRIASQPMPAQKEIQLRYAIGKYFDDVKDFEQAFINFRRANELTSLNRPRHDRLQLTQVVDSITQSYDQIWLNRTRINALESARPVFIVGMLRSGTTLAEQILASHPAVYGAGELTFWSTASATYQSSPLDVEANGCLLRKLADDYLRLLDDISGDALRVVDKMPTNFAFLGLIHAALPNARIIHMRRNPMDTCLSIYGQHFEAAVSYANDLEDLAHYYTEYLRVMEHWRLTLPRGVIMDVPYEELVGNQEAWSRKMLEFIGLPWDPRCLDFHATNRTVITASKWQVRQKIHRSSIERWRHYEKFLGPLLDSLGRST
jgi:tetratricopeptide (TPR) repeat protein